MIWDKLKEIRELSGYSQGDVSEKTGIKQKDISLLEAGKKKFIPIEYIHFLYKLGVDINSLYDDSLSIQWMQGGKSDDTPTSDPRIGGHPNNKSTNTPIAKNANIKDSNKILHPTKAENLHPTLHPTRNLGTPFVITTDNTGRENVVMVPVRARAGYLDGYGDPEFIQTLPTYTLPGLRNGTFRAFELEGHSMNPTLKNHDIVIGSWVESIEDIRDDRVYVIVTKNKGIVIKRVLNRVNEYGFLVCKSDSVTNRQDYPNLQIHPEDILELWYSRMFLSSDFKAPSDVWQRINDLEAGFEYLKTKL